MTNPSVIGGMANSLMRACKKNFGPGEDVGINILPRDGERTPRPIIPQRLPPSQRIGTMHCALYGDEPGICVMHLSKNDRVFVTDQKGLANIRSSTNGPFPIGFTRDNVVEYSLTAEMQIKRRRNDKTGLSGGSEIH